METRGEINAEIDKKIHEEIETLIGIFLWGCRFEVSLQILPPQV